MVKKKTDISIRSSAAEYLTFVAATGDSEESVEMRYEDENIWLTQKMMATLYDISVAAINQHIKKVSYLKYDYILYALNFFLTLHYLLLIL